MPLAAGVAIVANRTGFLSIGGANDLLRRVWDHRTGSGSVHAAAYHITRLVVVVDCASANDVLTREKQLKGWRREKKLALIVAQNPAWRVMAEAALGPAP